MTKKHLKRLVNAFSLKQVADYTKNKTFLKIILTLCTTSQIFSCDCTGIPIQLERATGYRLHHNVIKYIGFFKLCNDIKEEVEKSGNIKKLENRLSWFIKDSPQYAAGIAQAMLDALSRNMSSVISIKDVEVSQEKLNANLLDEELQSAARENNIEKTLKLIRRGAKINREYKGLRALQIALQLEVPDLEYTLLLLKHGAEVKPDDLILISNCFPKLGLDLLEKEIIKTNPPIDYFDFKPRYDNNILKPAEALARKFIQKQDLENFKKVERLFSKIYSVELPEELQVLSCIYATDTVNDMIISGRNRHLDYLYKIILEQLFDNIKFGLFCDNLTVESIEKKKEITNFAISLLPDNYTVSYPTIYVQWIRCKNEETLPNLISIIIEDYYNRQSKNTIISNNSKSFLSFLRQLLIDKFGYIEKKSSSCSLL